MGFEKEGCKLTEEHDDFEISDEEFLAMEKKHADSKRMFSVILEGLAVFFVNNMKKRAKRTGSRGSYISECIIYAEKHRRSEDFIQTAEDEAFELQLRVFYLERLLRENGIEFETE